MRFASSPRDVRECALVAVDCDLGFEAPSVHVRQEHGAYLATKYLLSLGHTKIAYLRGPMVWRVARLRYQGWLRQ